MTVQRKSFMRQTFLIGLPIHDFNATYFPNEDNNVILMNSSVSSLLISSNPVSRQSKGSTSRTGTSCLWKDMSTPRVFGWVCVAHFLVFCIEYCGPLFVILLSAVVLSVLRFTGSDLQIFLIFQKIQIFYMSPEIFYRGSCYSIFSFMCMFCR